MAYRGNNRNNPSSSGEQGKDHRDCEAMRKLFIGGLHRDSTEDNFNAHFAKFGTITDSVIMKDPHTKAPRGFGFVTYDTPDSVEEVFKNRPHDLDGRTLDCKRAMPREFNTEASHGKTTRLFVGGVGHHMTPEELKGYLRERHGHVCDIDGLTIDFLKDREDPSKNRGIGFIECGTSDLADRLTISEQSFSLSGRSMNIKKAEQKTGEGGGAPRGGGGGNRGGMRGGRGGSDQGGRGGRGGGYSSGNQGGGYGGQSGGYGGQSGGYGGQSGGYAGQSGGYGGQSGGYGGQSQSNADTYANLGGYAAPAAATGGYSGGYTAPASGGYGGGYGASQPAASQPAASATGGYQSQGGYAAPQGGQGGYSQGQGAYGQGQGQGYGR